MEVLNSEKISESERDQKWVRAGAFPIHYCVEWYGKTKFEKVLVGDRIWWEIGLDFVERDMAFGLDHDFLSGRSCQSRWLVSLCWKYSQNLICLLKT